jgi:hypothetical protein
MESERYRCVTYVRRPFWHGLSRTFFNSGQGYGMEYFDRPLYSVLCVRSHHRKRTQDRVQTSIHFQKTGHKRSWLWFIPASVHVSQRYHVDFEHVVLTQVFLLVILIGVYNKVSVWSCLVETQNHRSSLWHLFLRNHLDIVRYRPVPRNVSFDQLISSCSHPRWPGSGWMRTYQSM